MSKSIGRRQFLKLAGLAGAGMALAGCAPAATQAPVAPTSAPVAGATAAPTMRKFKKTNLVAPSWWAPHETATANAAFSGEFTKETGLTLKYQSINTDFNTAVFTNLASDTPFDVITFNADSVPVYLDRGVLAPLNPYIERDKYDTSNIVPVALSQWTYGDTIYGLTADCGSFHAYFNYDLFAKAGLTPPKPTDLWTWDQLLEYAQKLTIKDSSGNITQYGLAVDTNGTWEIWPNMNGAFVFDDGLKKCVIDDPASIAAFQLYQDLIYKYNVCLKPGATKVALNDVFLAGQAAILFDGTWQVGYFRSKMAEMKQHWDVGLLPYGPAVKNPSIPNFTAGWVLPKVAQDPDASWEAIKFYASDYFAQNVMFTSLSGLPCTKTTLAAEWYNHWPKETPQGVNLAFYTLMLQYGVARRHLKFDLGTDIPASLAKLDTIYSNEKKPADLLPQIATEINGYLTNMPWNKS
jgi:multiple sugar transport system substrate-binding protein